MVKRMVVVEKCPVRSRSGTNAPAVASLSSVFLSVPVDVVDLPQAAAEDHDGTVMSECGPVGEDSFGEDSFGGAVLAGACRPE